MAQAQEIGSAEAAGFSWRDINIQLEQIKTVTADEVQAVAKKYFADDGLTIAVLDPQPVDPNAPKRTPVGFRH
jgi:zinc protease